MMYVQLLFFEEEEEEKNHAYHPPQNLWPTKSHKIFD